MPPAFLVEKSKQLAVFHIEIITNRRKSDHYSQGLVGIRTASQLQYVWMMTRPVFSSTRTSAKLAPPPGLIE